VSEELLIVDEDYGAQKGDAAHKEKVAASSGH
jgi:hypothetical protein